jgi:hypothetical protein
MNYKEALLTVALYAFILSALALPIVIGYFTRAFYRRLKRLDEAIGIVIETEKYNGKDDERIRGQFPGD